eukprot:scaffold1952_cov85-Skeletonema_dohrnii-CCMP3373.AAC.3
MAIIPKLRVGGVVMITGAATQEDASVHTYLSLEGVKLAGEALAQTTVAVGRNNDKQVQVSSMGTGAWNEGLRTRTAC